MFGFISGAETSETPYVLWNIIALYTDCDTVRIIMCHGFAKETYSEYPKMTKKLIDAVGKNGGFFMDCCLGRLR